MVNYGEMQSCPLLRFVRHDLEQMTELRRHDHLDAEEQARYSELCRLESRLLSLPERTSRRCPVTGGSLAETLWCIEQRQCA